MTIEDVKVKILEYIGEAEMYGFPYGVGRDILLDHFGIEDNTKDIYIFNRAIYQMLKSGDIFLTGTGYYKINKAR